MAAGVPDNGSTVMLLTASWQSPSKVGVASWFAKSFNARLGLVKLEIGSTPSHYRCHRDFVELIDWIGSKGVVSRTPLQTLRCRAQSDKTPSRDRDNRALPHLHLSGCREHRLQGRPIHRKQWFEQRLLRRLPIGAQ